MATLTIADWVILAIIASSALISLVRGFVKEALSLANWAVAFFVAVAFHGQMYEFLQDWISKPYLRDILAYVLLFVTTLVIGSLLINLLAMLVEHTGLSGTDRMLGMVFGAARGLIVVMALLILLPSLFTDIDRDLWWQESSLIPHFLLMRDWAMQSFAEITQWFTGLLDGHRSAVNPAASTAL